MNLVITNVVGLLAIAAIIAFVFAIILLVCQWKIFKKAGEEGWKSIVPIYNTYIYLKICGISGWFMLIFFLPLVPIENITQIASLITGIFSFYTSYKLSKAFGHGFWYALGIFFLPIIFIPILAFGKSEYTLDF